MQDVEAQMRRALGLFGAPRRPEQERPAAQPAPRQNERFGAAHGHKRRFVQDGEVPVTVLHGRKEHGTDGSQGKLEAVEAALAAEQGHRSKVERALAEANATVHDLRTKLGHANLSQSDLQAATKRDHEAVAALRAELREMSERVLACEASQARAEERATLVEEEFAAEHEARLEAEHNLRLAEIARNEAEQMLRDLNNDGPIDLPARRPGRVPKPAADGKPRPVRTRVVRSPDEPEPEPVQWWLTPATKARRK